MADSGAWPAVACSSRKTSVRIHTESYYPFGLPRFPMDGRGDRWARTSTIARSVPSSSCDRSWSKFLSKGMTRCPPRTAPFPFVPTYSSFSCHSPIAAPRRRRPQPSDAMLAHARKLLRSTPLIDGHNDLPWAIRESETAPRDVKAYDLRAPDNGTHRSGAAQPGRAGRPSSGRSTSRARSRTAASPGYSSSSSTSRAG